MPHLRKDHLIRTIRAGLDAQAEILVRLQGSLLVVYDLAVSRAQLPSAERAELAKSLRRAKKCALTAQEVLGEMLDEIDDVADA